MQSKAQRKMREWNRNMEKHFPTKRLPPEMTRDEIDSIVRVACPNAYSRNKRMADMQFARDYMGDDY